MISVVSCTKPQTPNENLPSVDLGQQPGANTGTGGGTDTGTGNGDENGGGQTGNNPPETNPPETPAPVCPPEVGSVPAGSVVVNDGALMTNNVSVNLKLIFKEALKMKILSLDVVKPIVEKATANTPSGIPIKRDAYLIKVTEPTAKYEANR